MYMNFMDCRRITLQSVGLLHIGLACNVRGSLNGPYFVKALLKHLCLPQLECLSLKLVLEHIHVCLDYVLAEPMTTKSPN